MEKKVIEGTNERQERIELEAGAFQGQVHA